MYVRVSMGLCLCNFLIYGIKRTQKKLLNWILFEFNGFLLYFNGIPLWQFADLQI